MAEKDILIVDDDPNMSDGVSEILEMEGFIPHVAGTLADAVRLINEKHPAVVLTDYQLPDGPGTVLSAKIKAVLPKTGVLLVTGRTLSPEEKSKAAADDYITKPFNMPDLIARIKQLMQGRK